MSVGDINVKLGLDTSAFSSGLATVKAQAMALGGTFDGLGKSLSNLGVGGGPLGGIGKALSEITTTSNLAVVAVGAIGIAAISAGAQLTKMAADYQSAMAKVGATTGQSAAQLKEMQDIMYQATAAGSKLNMNQQAGIAAGLGGAGLIDANTSAKETAALLKLVEQGMVALESPTDSVIELFAILQTRYGSTTEEMSRTTSSIAQMADATSATNPQIIQAALSMGRLAGTVQMTEPEMIALAAATKQFGIEAPEVGTQWSSLTRSLASNSKETKKAFEDVGMSQDDYFKALQDSKNTGSNAPVLKFLKDLDKGLQKSDNSAKLSMQLYGSYGATLGASISQVIGKYEELIPSSQQAYQENVRITQEYERQTNTLNSMLTGIGAKFNAMGVQVGTALLGPIQDATYQLDQFLGKLMMGDMAGAWKGLYDSLLNYNWVGAGATIVQAIGSGLLALANFGVQAAVQLAVALLQHDWIGSGRSIAAQILNGFDYLKSGVTSLLSGMASWVSSGGAFELGRSLGNWIIDGAEAVVTAGFDLYNWIKSNLSIESIGKMVASGLEGAMNLASIGLKAGKDFIGGISSAISSAGGSYFNGVKTAASQLVKDISALGVDVAKAGVNWVISAMDGVLGMISTALAPILGAVNSILGTDFSVPSSTGMSKYEGVDVGGKAAKVYDSAGNLINAVNPFSGMGSKESAVGEEGVGGLDKGTALGYVNKGNYLGFIEAQAAAGLSMGEAQKAAEGKFGNQTFAAKDIQGAWNKGKYTSMGNTSGYGKQGGGGGAATGTTADKASGSAVSAMSETWSGGVVPVEVTNWPAGGIGGGGGAAAGGVAVPSTNSFGQTVDAQGRPVGKFDATKINNTGPGIGMVKTEGGNSNASYADRLNISTCEIDSFGMTPGLGKELAASGAWKPNSGAASQKLASEIGYSGDYASNYGASVGSMSKSEKIQTNTATKTAGITIGGSQKAASTFQIGTSVATQRNAQTMDAAALNAKISLEDGAYSCFEAIDGGARTFSQEMALSAAEQKGASVVVRDNIQAGGQHAKENSLSSSLDFSNSVTTSGSAFSTSIASATTSLGAMLGGIPSMMGYASGGGYGGGGGGGGGGSSVVSYNGSSGANWGGTSISGGGGHIGGGASSSGWGAAASNAARGGGGGSAGSVKWYASGGVVNKPSVVGVGESGSEAIVPLGKLPEIMSQAMGGGAGAHGHAINVDGKKIADAVGSAMISRTRQGSGLKVR